VTRREDDTMGRRQRGARSTKSWAQRLAVLVLVLAFPGCALPFARGSTTSTPSAATPSTAPSSVNPITVENARPGTNEWQFGAKDYSGTGPEIQGYTAPASVNLGESVRLYVSTTASSFTYKVFRMGWYQGLGGRLMYTSHVLTGVKQPAPLYDAQTRTVSASNWKQSDTISIGGDWVSGVYLIKMYSSARYVHYAVFVVRDDARTSDLLTQISFLTYQAYNSWGGRSLYSGHDAAGKLTADERSYKVSFDRPYSDYFGIGNLGYSELNIIRWMERQGYDLSYTTDMDVGARGSLLAQHHLLVIPGHDEYWTTDMRKNVTAARDSGMSLAFFSANNIYWHVRLEDSPLGADRIETCYRDTVHDPQAASNPSEATVRWRDPPLNNPERTLIGQQYSGIVTAPSEFILSAGAQPFLAGTSLQGGTSFANMLDGEYDKVADPAVYPSQVILTSSPVQCTSSDCPSSGHDISTSVIYTTPGGHARVFDAGSFYWAWGLDDLRLTEKGRTVKSDANFQKFTANVFAYLLTGSHPGAA
jgi:hypothetical protein